MDESVLTGDSRGVRYEQDGRVGHIVLARPDAANAFDLPAATALGVAVMAARAAIERDEIGAVVVRAEGKRFCAGGDVRSFVSADDRAAYLLDLATRLEAELRHLSELAVPVVAAVHGAVAGAGLSFLLNADVVLAAPGTRFAMAYAGIGLTPDCGVSYLLPRAIGQARALELALTGRVLSADEALAWGLVTEVVDDASTRAADLARSLAAGSVGPARALGQAKRLIRSSWEASREDSAADEAATIAAAVESAEARALIEAFASR